MYMNSIGGIDLLPMCPRAIPIQALSVLFPNIGSTATLKECIQNMQSVRRINLNKKGFSGPQNSALLDSLVTELVRLFTIALATSPITKFFEFLFKTNSMTRIYQQALITKRMFDSRKDPKYFGMDENRFPMPTLFGHVIPVWHKHLVAGTEPKFDLIEAKELADKFAASKDYRESIAFYESIYIISTGSQALTVQALTNSAALRLRLSVEDPRHVMVAIFETTRALEMDSNNVKALFRRGLGLALSKKWDLAIIDFERALELDPLSPAKKELEVARRQVTRRIGS